MSIYRSFGVEPIINASSSVTRLGGAPMPPEVLDAFRDGADEWVPLEQMQAAASRKIAEVTGAEAGLVTSGSAAALLLGTAAILCRDQPALMEQLPFTENFTKNEFVIAREQRNGYDHAVRAAGARLVEVGFNEIISNAGVRRTEVWEYEAAFGRKTAGVVYGFSSSSRPALKDLVERAHHHGIPVIVDAAGEVYPRTNLKSLISSGADLVCYSGGKALRGPQSTGILCGRKELIQSAAVQMLDMDDHPELWNPPADFIDRSRMAGMPRHGIGRPLKVSKEEIVALLTALDLFAAGKYDEDLRRYRDYFSSIKEQLSECAASLMIIDAGNGETPPVLEIFVDEQRLGRTAFEICRRLREGSPPVYVSHGKLAQATLVIYPLCLKADQIPDLVRRLREELTP